METLKLTNKQNTQMIAHRGLSSFEKENTIASFIAAGNHSYFGCECDIHPTLDGVLVVIHDSDTIRVAGESKIVEKCTYQELQTLTLLDVEGKRKYPYQKIPTFEEYIAVCKKYGKKCIVEFKQEFEEQYIYQTIATLKAQEYLDETIFISFWPKNLVKARTYLPNQPMQFLCSTFNEDIYNLCVENHFGLDINYTAITQEIVDRYHEKGLVVNVWTVDKVEDGNRLIKMGVDFITTNRLE